MSGDGPPRGRVGRRCRHPRCCELVTEGRYCAAHQADEPKRWGNDPLPFYSSARWQKVRANALSRDPVCVRCERQRSTVANHKLPARYFPELRFVLSNIEGMCRECHDEHSRKEQAIYSQLGSAERIRAYFLAAQKAPPPGGVTDE